MRSKECLDEPREIPSGKRNNDTVRPPTLPQGSAKFAPESGQIKDFDSMGTA
jgi:hypothetical protein